MSMTRSKIQTFLSSYKTKNRLIEFNHQNRIELFGHNAQQYTERKPGIEHYYDY